MCRDPGRFLKGKGRGRSGVLWGGGGPARVIWGGRVDIKKSGARGDENVTRYQDNGTSYHIFVAQAPGPEVFACMAWESLGVAQNLRQGRWGGEFDGLEEGHWELTADVNSPRKKGKASFFTWSSIGFTRSF